MKKILCPLILFVSTICFGQSSDITKSLDSANSNHKMVLVTFSGSDWCIPCIRMEKEVLEKEPFVSYAQHHLVVVKADFPRLKKHQLSKEVQKENSALAEKYNKKGTFPFTVLLDGKGNIIKEWEGAIASTPEVFVHQLEALQHEQ
ncbi:MAG: thioredoxin family protein [Chitinophagaceae bacterium]